MKHLFKYLYAAAGLATLLAPAATFAQIQEPDTIFYGEIVNRTSGQVELITQGKVAWTLVRPDGVQITLTAKLQSLNNGHYSYSLLVPQQALSYGLTVASDAVPLTAASATCSQLYISVNGQPASILAPGTETFAVSQSLRASTYRLDLELTNNLPDTTGDGIPDWWKALYGITSASAIPGNDGWSNLQKFLNGGNPNQDNRLPTLDITEFWVYADGRTEIPLHAIDSDSAVTNINYTLTNLPAGGYLCRHTVNTNGGVTDVPLGLNSSFSQAAVNQGQVIFVHNQTNAPAVPTTFGVILCDETPSHATNYTITLDVYRPNYSAAITALAGAAASAPKEFSDLPGLGFGEQRMLINYLLSRDHGYIVADSSRAAMSNLVTAASASVSVSQDSPYVLEAGAGNDRLVGGTANDILIPGRGNVTMRGNGGANLFLLPGTAEGNETIEDFSVTNGDALDISRVLQGASSQLTNYIQLTTVGTNSVLAINCTGSGAGYTNLTVVLLGVQFTMANLRSLVDNSNLITGNIALSPSVSIVASQPNASQNGPVSGQFTLSRDGSLAVPLSVNLTISGSAANGSDYQLIPNPVTFPAGQNTVTVPINPYSTASTLPQIVQVALAPGAGYVIGSSAQDQVTIQPLLPQITIQALVPEALTSGLTPGIFLVSRAGIANDSVLVKLTISGTASTSTDYAAVPNYLLFSPNQTAALISITPKATANLANGTKFVQIAIATNASYAVLSPSVDRVFIVNQLYTGDAWQAQYFPAATQSWSTFANLDPGNTGIKNLYRYAYGLNPTNPSSSGLPYYRFVNGHLAVTFRQPVDVTDMDYVVQVSYDLLNWSSLSNQLQAFVPTDVATNIESVSFLDTASVTNTPNQYMRVVPQPQ